MALTALQVKRVNSASSPYAGSGLDMVIRFYGMITNTLLSTYNVGTNTFTQNNILTNYEPIIVTVTGTEADYLTYTLFAFTTETATYTFCFDSLAAGTTNIVYFDKNGCIYTSYPYSYSKMLFGDNFQELYPERTEDINFNLEPDISIEYSDILNIADDVNVDNDIVYSESEQVEILQVINIDQGIIKEYLDNVQISDYPNIANEIILETFDNIGINDIAYISEELIKEVSDLLTLLDIPNTYQELVEEAFDSLILSDISNIYEELIKETSDSLTLSDIPNIYEELFLETEEIILLEDILIIQKEQFLETSDSFGIIDFVYMPDEISLETLDFLSIYENYREDMCRLQCSYLMTEDGKYFITEDGKYFITEFYEIWDYIDIEESLFVSDIITVEGLDTQVYHNVSDLSVLDSVIIEGIDSQIYHYLSDLLIIEDDYFEREYFSYNNLGITEISYIDEEDSITKNEYMTIKASFPNGLNYFKTDNLKIKDTVPLVSILPNDIAIPDDYVIGDGLFHIYTKGSD